MHMTALSNNDLGPLRDALTQAGLPVDDLTYSGRQFFSSNHQGVDVGFAGIEGEGAERLLRSLVVLEGQRGRGAGVAVLAAVEAFARREGVERLHLLTDSAAAFFTGQGYQQEDRSLAPASISATAQFKTLCPASATYLSKRLV
ncbi:MULTISPECIES: arsenic resistance N-acetyltransferase ArsN2 [Pseudomonas]|uniref:Tyrosine protein phosphatase n=1 Tax=Pseudomonas fluorescens TaxID=294 RepID=A0A0N9W2U6_PSEFL|nr:MULTISPECIES: arsenic resistance N-acetyltransferase ArsN2 [Pseudomonas]ALI05577.1 tyrosine protein phosphatase [Pseudomonas fluorescens]